jgi:hypothetical protein
MKKPAFRPTIKLTGENGNGFDVLCKFQDRPCLFYVQMLRPELLAYCMYLLLKRNKMIIDL